MTLEGERTSENEFCQDSQVNYAEMAQPIKKIFGIGASLEQGNTM